MNVAVAKSPQWSVSARRRGEVLTAGTTGGGLELLVLSTPGSFTVPEFEGWLRDLLGVTRETASGDQGPRPIPALLHHALTGLLFSHAELWERAGAQPPCSLAFVVAGGRVAFGWVGDARVGVWVNDQPVENGWVKVRDDEGREAFAIALDWSPPVRVRLVWSAPNAGEDGPGATVDAEWPGLDLHAPPATPAPAATLESVPAEAGAEVGADAAALEVETTREWNSAAERAPSFERGESIEHVPSFERAEPVERVPSFERSEPVEPVESFEPAAEPVAPVENLEEFAHAESGLGQAIHQAIESARQDAENEKPYELVVEAPRSAAVEPTAGEAETLERPRRRPGRLGRMMARISSLWTGEPKRASQPPEPVMPPTEALASQPEAEPAPDLASEPTLAPEPVAAPRPRARSLHILPSIADAAAPAEGDTVPTHASLAPPVLRVVPRVPAPSKSEPEAEPRFARASLSPSAPAPAPVREPRPTSLDQRIASLAREDMASPPRPSLATPPEPEAQARPVTLWTPPAAGQVADTAPVPELRPVEPVETSSVSPAGAEPPVGPQHTSEPDTMSEEPPVPRNVSRHRSPLRPQWPTASEMERPTPLWKRPWVWAAVLVALFFGGWMVGGIQNDRDTGGANDGLHRTMRLLGLAGARFDVTISSRPPGAWISVDGKDLVRRTPASIDLPPGEHLVSLSMSDLGSASFKVRGQRGDRVALDAPLWGSITVAESDAALPVSVAFDGTALGFAPVTVDSVMPGAHELRFSGPGMVPWGQTVEVRVQQAAQVLARPMTSPATGVLVVQGHFVDEEGSRPLTGAEAYVDGVLRGRTPLTLELPRGPHSVRVSKAGENSPVQVIDLPGGNQRFASFELGLGIESPRLVSIGIGDRVVQDRPTMASAMLEGVSVADVREMWLHVRTPEGPWRRYPMDLLKSSTGAVGVSVFPNTMFDETGRAPYYMSALTSTGDEYYTEIVTAQLVGPGRPSARQR
jgi:hypothetical protein